MKWVLLASFLLFTLWSEAKQAPSFEGKLLDGGRIKLRSQLSPGRALLLSFWATWCSPCLEELKLVTENLKTSGDLPLDLLTINVDTSETASDIRPTLKLYHFSFPVILDPQQEIFSKYNQNHLLPFSVLIDPQGKILETYNGFHADMMAKLKQKLFEGLKPQAPASQTMSIRKGKSESTHS